MGSDPLALPVTETRWRTGGLTPFLCPRRPARKMCRHTIARLRKQPVSPSCAAVLARLERARSGPPAHLPLGVGEMQAHLPGPGLACGVLHEVAAAAYGDRPAAFGFVFALTACGAEQARPALPCSSPRGAALADFGAPTATACPARPRRRPAAAGRDRAPTRTRCGRSRRRCARERAPAMVAGAVAGGLDLTISRRLNLAAGPQRTPLVLLRAACARSGTSAAATRWRIAAAPAARDRFGAFAHWRWSVALERCRNGRPGRVAYRVGSCRASFPSG